MAAGVTDVSVAMEGSIFDSRKSSYPPYFGRILDAFHEAFGRLTARAGDELAALMNRIVVTKKGIYRREPNRLQLGTVYVENEIPLTIWDFETLCPQLLSVGKLEGCCSACPSIQSWRSRGSVYSLFFYA